MLKALKILYFLAARHTLGGDPAASQISERGVYYVMGMFNLRIRL